MQIQHVDVTLSSFQTPGPDELAVPTGQAVEHLVPIVGTPGVWDAWFSAQSSLSGFVSLSVEAIPEDTTKLRLTAQAEEADQRVTLRLYALSG